MSQTSRALCLEVEVALNQMLASGLALGCAAAIGAIVGGALLIWCLRRGVVTVRSVELPRQVLALDSLNVSIALKAENDSVVASATHTAALSGAVSRVVEDWLDSNGLVVQFKGPDFRPALRATKGTP